MTDRPPLPWSGLGRNLTHGLLDVLGCAIVTGAFDDRTFPTEAELARHYAVSRPVTREAVKMLTAKGLLSARPRRGTVVQPEARWNLFDPDVLRWLLERKFSLTLLRQFGELRLSIEPAAAALAARSATGAGRALVEAAFRRMVAAGVGQDDPLGADIAFHAAILEASGNPFHAQFRDVVATALRSSARITDRFGDRSLVIPAHRAVNDAIQARNGAGAHAAMTLMLRGMMALISEVARRSASGAGPAPLAARPGPAPAGDPETSRSGSADQGARPDRAERQAERGPAVILRERRQAARR